MTVKPDIGELPMRVEGDSYGYAGNLYVVARFEGRLYAYSTQMSADFWPWQWKALPAKAAEIPPTGMQWPLTVDVPFWGLPRTAFSDGTAQADFNVNLGSDGRVDGYADLKGLHVYAGFKAPGTVVRSVADLVEVLATPDH
ncbi:hypothetical protein [Chitinimonas sp.]|uniref:hypothetical protein n=1 Tax=Chitinimonas sp. TaxID=1934313 RepID=UPI0035B42159